jgi:hypothetical protein
MRTDPNDATALPKQIVEQAPAPAVAGAVTVAETKVNIKLPNGTSLSCSPPSGGTLDCTLVAAPAEKSAAPATPKVVALGADSKAASSDTKSTAAALNPAATADAIAGMQRAFVGLSAIGPLMVACISEFDPSRVYAGGSLEYPPDYKRDPRDSRLPHKVHSELLDKKNCGQFFEVVADGTKQGFTTLNEVAVDNAKATLLQAQAALLAAQKGQQRAVAQ